MKIRKRARLMKRRQALRTLGPRLRAELRAVGQGLMRALDDMQQDVRERRGPNPRMSALLRNWYSHLKHPGPPTG